MFQLVSGRHVGAHPNMVVTRMDTSKSGWTPYVYYTTLYSTPRHTIFRRIYWARELLEKWGNQSKRQLCKEIGCSCFKGTQHQFSENFCSEDDLRSRIFGTFVVKFLACLPLLGFSNI